ncbi:MAG: hypothetical protein IKO74_07415 [Selenomonadaceae bacterium]|nr:hypothetical protein [Selenomonadaceae bacterium]
MFKRTCTIVAIFVASFMFSGVENIGNGRDRGFHENTWTNTTTEITSLADNFAAPI